MILLQTSYKKTYFRALSSASLQPILTKLLIVYFASLLFLFPYGIKSIGLRYSDIFGLALMFFSAAAIINSWRINKVKLELISLFLLTFIAFEIFLPVLGVLYFAESSLISSTIRALFTWMPLLLFFLVYKNDFYSLSKPIEKLLWFAVLINIFIAITQVLIFYGVLPSSFDIKGYFSALAMDARFDKRTSMASGLFINTTALAIFSFLAFVFFWSNYLRLKSSKYFVRSIFAFFLLLLAVSRAPLLGALFVIVASLPLLGFTRAITRIPLIVGLLILLFFILTVFGYDPSTSFHRFQRLEGGLENDYSWMYRYTVIWPAMLEEIKNYPWGTLSNPTIFLGTIDSGYFSYYLQGKLVFIITLLGLVFSVLFTGFKVIFLRKYNQYSFALLAIFLYLAGGMITSNPIREPLIAFFILYYFFANQAEARPKQ